MHRLDSLRLIGGAFSIDFATAFAVAAVPTNSPRSSAKRLGERRILRRSVDHIMPVRICKPSRPQNAIHGSKHFAERVKVINIAAAEILQQRPCRVDANLEK